MFPYIYIYISIELSVWNFLIVCKWLLTYILFELSWSVVSFAKSCHIFVFYIVMKIIYARVDKMIAGNKYHELREWIYNKLKKHFSNEIHIWNVTQTHDRHSCVLIWICPNIYLLLILKCVCKYNKSVTTSFRTSVFPKTVFFLVYVNVSFIVNILNIWWIFSRRNVRLGYNARNIQAWYHWRFFCDILLLFSLYKESM